MSTITSLFETSSEKERRNVRKYIGSKIYSLYVQMLENAFSNLVRGMQLHDTELFHNMSWVSPRAAALLLETLQFVIIPVDL